MLYFFSYSLLCLIACVIQLHLITFVDLAQWIAEMKVYRPNAEKWSKINFNEKWISHAFRKRLHLASKNSSQNPFIINSYITTKNENSRRCTNSALSCWNNWEETSIECNEITKRFETFQKDFPFNNFISFSHMICWKCMWCGNLSIP